MRECDGKATSLGDRQDNFLDAEIQKDGIHECIKRMKRGKWHDVHGINIELISWGSTSAVKQFAKLES